VHGNRISLTSQSVPTGSWTIKLSLRKTQGHSLPPRLNRPACCSRFVSAEASVCGGSLFFIRSVQPGGWGGQLVLIVVAVAMTSRPPPGPGGGWRWPRRHDKADSLSVRKTRNEDRDLGHSHIRLVRARSRLQAARSDGLTRQTFAAFPSGVVAVCAADDSAFRRALSSAHSTPFH
jgi:hypothetical protein